MIVAAMAASPKNSALRIGALLAVVAMALLWIPYSRHQLEHWKKDTIENKKIAEKIAARITSHGPTSQERHYYVLGLPRDSYFLDPMIKLQTSPSFHDRLVMPGDQAAFVWIPENARGVDLTSEEVKEGLPELTVHPSDPEVVLATANPPDLLSASMRDTFSRVLEYDGVELEDITDELRRLYRKREQMQKRTLRYHEKRRCYLKPCLSAPSFTFRKTPMGLSWNASDSIKVEEPLRQGTPYNFIATSNDPYLISPEIYLPSLSVSGIEIEMVIPERTYLPPGEEKGCVMWNSEDSTGFLGKNSECFSLFADGKAHTYHVDLESNIEWARSGTVDRVRLDPKSYPGPFQLIRVAFTVN